MVDLSQKFTSLIAITLVSIILSSMAPFDRSMDSEENLRKEAENQDRIADEINDQVIGLPSSYNIRIVEVTSADTERTPRIMIVEPLNESTLFVVMNCMATCELRSESGLFEPTTIHVADHSQPRQIGYKMNHKTGIVESTKFNFKLFPTMVRNLVVHEWNMQVVDGKVHLFSSCPIADPIQLQQLTREEAIEVDCRSVMSRFDYLLYDIQVEAFDLIEFEVPQGEFQGIELTWKKGRFFLFGLYRTDALNLSSFKMMVTRENEGETTQTSVYSSIPNLDEEAVHELMIELNHDMQMISSAIIVGNIADSSIRQGPCSDDVLCFISNRSLSHDHRAHERIHVTEHYIVLNLLRSNNPSAMEESGFGWDAFEIGETRFNDLHVSSPTVMILDSALNQIDYLQEVGSDITSRVGGLWVWTGEGILHDVKEDSNQNLSFIIEIMQHPELNLSHSLFDIQNSTYVINWEKDSGFAVLKAWPLPGENTGVLIHSIRTDEFGIGHGVVLWNPTNAQSCPFDTAEKQEGGDLRLVYVQFTESWECDLVITLSQNQSPSLGGYLKHTGLVMIGFSDSSELIFSTYRMRIAHAGWHFTEHLFIMSNSHVADDDWHGVHVLFERDHDSIDAREDNCPTMSNENQSDLDGDGIGDECDSDRDGDEVEDSNDHCPEDAERWNQSHLPCRSSEAGSEHGEEIRSEVGLEPEAEPNPGPQNQSGPDEQPASETNDEWTDGTLITVQLMIGASAILIIMSLFVMRQEPNN